MTNLGKLEKVDLREIWANEATEFTPWLAREENLAIPGNTLGGIELELEGTEQNVGPFNADIVCKYAWIKEKLEGLHSTFSSRLKSLEPVSANDVIADDELED